MADGVRGRRRQPDDSGAARKGEAGCRAGRKPEAAALREPTKHKAARGGSNGMEFMVRSTYTFWSGARPSRPCGRRIITAIRIPNTIRFVYVDEMYPEIIASATPSRTPPSIAPAIEPIPPTTAAV